MPKTRWLTYAVIAVYLALMELQPMRLAGMSRAPLYFNSRTQPPNPSVAARSLTHVRPGKFAPQVDWPLPQEAWLVGDR